MRYRRGACNSTLRSEMRRAGEECGVPVFFPSPILCTDSAAMIACAAAYRYQMAPHYYHERFFLGLDAQARSHTIQCTC